MPQLLLLQCHWPSRQQNKVALQEIQCTRCLQAWCGEQHDQPDLDAASTAAFVHFLTDSRYPYAHMQTRQVHTRQMKSSTVSVRDSSAGIIRGTYRLTFTAPNTSLHHKPAMPGYSCCSAKAANKCLGKNTIQECKPITNPQHNSNIQCGLSHDLKMLAVFV
jgi:hypothetical protein